MPVPVDAAVVLAEAAFVMYAGAFVMHAAVAFDGQTSGEIATVTGPAAAASHTAVGEPAMFAGEATAFDTAEDIVADTHTEAEGSASAPDMATAGVVERLEHRSGPVDKLLDAALYSVDSVASGAESFESAGLALEVHLAHVKALQSGLLGPVASVELAAP